MAASVLMDKDGKHVTIRKFQATMMLCAVESQPANRPLLVIHTRERNQKKQMALDFKVDGFSYVPKVEEGKLKIEKSKEVNFAADSFWFEKEDLGNNEHYGLRSVKSRQYLKEYCSSSNVFTFTLSDSEQDCTAVCLEPQAMY